MDRFFKLGAVLSVVSGKLLCPIDDLYEILNYMTGDDLMTHQLPRASKMCKPAILKQWPLLAEIKTDQINTENWKQELDAIISQIDVSELELTPLTKDEYKSIDPITEAIELTGDPDKVIVVTE
jgi:hypothetical protein